MLIKYTRCSNTMDQVKPSNRTIIYVNNTPMIYEYQDDPSKFGADPEKFFDVSDSDDLNEMIQKYKYLHGVESFESTSLKKIKMATLSRLRLLRIRLLNLMMVIIYTLRLKNQRTLVVCLTRLTNLV